MLSSQVVIVADLGFGDAGKGSTTDFLARFMPDTHTVVRYNGGSQAGHNVVTPDGRHHTFSQFGSGMFVPGTTTHLSRFMLVNPFNMFREEQHLRELGVANVFARTSIDREALVITPFHTAINRLRELSRGQNRHGSCGEGIGETMSEYLARPDDALVIGDLSDPAWTARKLTRLKERKLFDVWELGKLPESAAIDKELAVFKDPEIIPMCAEIYQIFAGLIRVVDRNYLGGLLNHSGTVLFEGAQGVLLDEWYGFHPYTTWSTTTFDNADLLLAEQGYTDRVTKLGALRAYATRHGPGPFVTEDPKLTSVIPDPYNVANTWQREFRRGYFDLVVSRYALEVAGPIDGLAITNLDGMVGMKEWQLCHSYRYSGSAADLPDYFETNGETIQRIKVRRPPNLDHQGRLTELLWECKPVYKTYRRDPWRYLDSLAAELGIPIALVSAGPKATDKSFCSFPSRLERSTERRALVRGGV